jgi:DNA repair exonuclease SbcCD ATPase subunit
MLAMTPIRSTGAWCACLTLALWPLSGAAQTAPAAPAKAATPPQIIVPAAPPKAAGPRTLGGKAPVGKMLTRDELRSCLKRLDSVNAGTRDLEGKRVALDKEKDELTKSGDALKADRADVDTRLAVVRDWEGRMRAHGTEIEGFNKRLTDAPNAPANQREALGKELDAERERLNKARVPLADEEARLVPAYQNAVKGYNEKAQARDALVADWNGRNKALNETAAKHDDERSAWLAECANRPYREDDEIAIKQGK